MNLLLQWMFLCMQTARVSQEYPQAERKPYVLRCYFNISSPENFSTQEGKIWVIHEGISHCSKSLHAL